jgi:hypothetical protein
MHLDGIDRTIDGEPAEPNIWHDLSGNDNHVQLFGNPTFTGNALQLNGTNQWARTVNTLDLSAFDQITVEVVARNPIFQNRTLILYEHSATTHQNIGGFVVVVHSDAINPGRQDIVTSAFRTTAVGDNDRRSVNYPITGNRVTNTKIYSSIASTAGRFAYMDGSRAPFVAPHPLHNNSVNIPTGFRNDNFFLGARNGAANFFLGYIYSVRIYGRALTAAEIANNHRVDVERFGTEP